MNKLRQISAWMTSNCNDLWEHSYGVSIKTIDNPGWWIEIDIAETSLETKNFSRIEKKISNSNWVVAFVEDKKFNAICGIDNIDEALEIFLNWSSDLQ